MIKINNAWVAVLLLAACQPSTQADSVTPNGGAMAKPSSEESVVGTAETSARQGTVSPPGCPSGNFEEFMQSFANDLEVQRTFTGTPLQKEHIETTGESEPAVVSEMLDGSELDFPIIPDSRRQTEAGLVLTHSKLSGGEMEVKLSKPDTDYQMLYFFRKDRCWKLYRISDESI